MRPSKKVSESLTEQQYLIVPAHINHYGRLFGGQLLKWIDELAGIVATRATLFGYYKKLYEELGLYEENRVQIHKYLVAVAEDA